MNTTLGILEKFEFPLPLSLYSGNRPSVRGGCFVCELVLRSHKMRLIRVSIFLPDVLDE